MATAKKVPAEGFDVQLTLTKREAEILKRVMGRINGSFDGPRRATSDIYNLLSDIGIADVVVQIEGGISLE
jgi:hypothetical protein